MKKKMLFMAALAGAVTLGSCVKDDVSGSVEAVRNAKANELNANANLANANADHVKALQAADLAYRQAQAAAEAAQAAINQALAEKDQAEADYEKARLADRIAAEVAKLQANLALEKANLEANLGTLATNIAANDLQNYTRVNTLIGNLQTAYSNWLTAQNTLVDAKVALETAKLSAELAQKTIDAKVIKAENDLAAEEAVLAFIKEQGQKGMSKAEIDARKKVIAEEQKELKLNYQNSAELPAFVEVSKKFPAIYKEYLAAEDALLKATETVKGVTGLDLYTQKAGDAGKGGVKTSEWTDMYNGGAGYVAYEVLGASGSKTTSFKYTDRNKKETSYTYVTDGEFKVYENKADAKKMADAIKAYDKTAEDAYYAALDELGSPEDVATTKVADGTKLTLYAEKAKAKDAQDDADYEVYKVQRDYDNAAEDLKAAGDNLTKKKAAWTDMSNALDKLYAPFTGTYPDGIKGDADKELEYRSTQASVQTNYTGRKNTGLVKVAEDAKKNVDKAQENIDTWLKTNKATVDKAAATLAVDQAKSKAATAAIEKAAEPLAAYVKATDALAAYEAEYNKAAKALMDVVQAPQKELNAELTALNAIYATDFNQALADQEEKVAKAAETLAKAKEAKGKNNPDLVIAMAEQDVDEAEIDLLAKAAALAAAQKAIEDAGIEFDIDGNDEPAAPADETPAEGEGESEGEGEEA